MIFILLISETKIDESFPSPQFHIFGYSTPFRLDRTESGECNRYCTRFPFKSRNLRTVHYGRETIPSLGPKIWSIIPNDIKNAPSPPPPPRLSIFLRIRSNSGSSLSVRAEFAIHTSLELVLSMWQTIINISFTLNILLFILFSRLNWFLLAHLKI